MITTVGLVKTGGDKPDRNIRNEEVRLLKIVWKRRTMLETIAIERRQIWNERPYKAEGYM